MSALPGVIGILVSIYVRPHELTPELREYNFLYFWLAVAVAGIVHDVRARRIRLASTPMLPYVIALWVWCLLTLAVRNLALFPENVIVITVCVVLYLLVSCPSQRLSTFFTIAVVIFSLGLFVAGVGAHQGLRPFQCVASASSPSSRPFAEGASCSNVDEEGAPRAGWVDCVSTGRPGIVYACEHVGVFETSSIQGRVRYLGVLEDPNDLSVATAMSLPFAFAFYQAKRSLGRLALLAVTIVVMTAEIVFTQSRGGQLTFIVVLGVYFVEKYGWKRGALVGAGMAVPMLLVGGRSGDSAENSTMERLGCACAAIRMLMWHPILGVGHTQFTENHGLTAHNSYLLAAGELGLPGMWLFTFILYLSVKVPASILRLRMSDDRDSRVIKALATAVLASFAGGVVGIFFLSWTYHYVLWIHFGLSGGLFALVKARRPSYECRLHLREAVRIAAGCIVFLIVWGQYIKYQNAWE
jgi:hypothetical protein